MTLKNLSSYNSKIMKAPSGELFRDMAAVVISMVANDTHTHRPSPHECRSSETTANCRFSKINEDLNTYNPCLFDPRLEQKDDYKSQRITYEKTIRQLLVPLF